MLYDQVYMRYTYATSKLVCIWVDDVRVICIY